MQRPWYRSLLEYGSLVGLPAIGLLVILDYGKMLEAPPAAEAIMSSTQSVGSGGSGLAMLLQLIVQMAVILVACRAVGYAFRAVKQPQVVGDMLAGILLGPSLLGWVAPGVYLWLFPAESLVHLQTLASVGLILFMFLIGLELDLKLLRGNGHAAVFTSHVSIIAPFFLGSALALYLFPRLGEQGVDFAGFALFMGAAMSVTAFPVLARILQERQLLHTKVGAMTIACAAVDDVTAWAILACVIAMVRASALGVSLWVTLIGSVVFMLVMVFAVRPALRTLGRAHEQLGQVTHGMLAIIFLVVLVSAFTTEYLGIHALFGAFCAGVVMPKSKEFVGGVAEKIEGVTVVLFLPLFFASAGLRTSIGLVEGAEMWGYAGLILAVAVAGKFGGSLVAARVTGLGWRDASALGILMNTRGLMELVILTIGLELGVISPTLFAMMVLMALATTFMTTPVLQWLYPLERMREENAVTPVEDVFRVLCPVSLPSTGPKLVHVASTVAPMDRPLVVYALHFRRLDGEGRSLVSSGSHEANEEHALLPAIAYAADEGIDVHPMVFASQRPGPDIADAAYVKNVDMVVMGWHKPLWREGVLGGAVGDVLSSSYTSVCVYVEANDVPWARLVVLHEHAFDPALDVFAMTIAARRALAVRHIVVGAAEERVRDGAPDGRAIEHARDFSGVARSLGDADLVLVALRREGEASRFTTDVIESPSGADVLLWRPGRA